MMGISAVRLLIINILACKRDNRLSCNLSRTQCVRTCCRLDLQFVETLVDMTPGLVLSPSITGRSMSYRLSGHQAPGKQGLLPFPPCKKRAGHELLCDSTSERELQRGDTGHRVHPEYSLLCSSITFDGQGYWQSSRLTIPPDLLSVPELSNFRHRSLEEDLLLVQLLRIETLFVCSLPFILPAHVQVLKFGENSGGDGNEGVCDSITELEGQMAQFHSEQAHMKLRT